MNLSSLDESCHVYMISSAQTAMYFMIQCSDIWVSGSLPLLYTCQWSLCGGTAGSRCRGVQRHQGGAQCCEVNQPPSKYDNRPDDHLGSVYNTESKPRLDVFDTGSLCVQAHAVRIFQLATVVQLILTVTSRQVSVL